MNRWAKLFKECFFHFLRNKGHLKNPITIEILFKFHKKNESYQALVFVIVCIVDAGMLVHLSRSSFARVSQPTRFNLWIPSILPSTTSIDIQPLFCPTPWGSREQSLPSSYVFSRESLSSSV